MNIVLLGANGGTGKQVMAKALERGHKVKAYVRRPETLSQADGLEIIGGQLNDLPKLQETIQGSDAVFCCIGPAVSLKELMRPQTLMQTSIATIIQAMEAAKVKRFVLLSAFGVGEWAKTATPLLKMAFNSLFSSVYMDKEKSEQMLRDSALDWTCVYPVFLRDNIESGNYCTYTIDQVKKVKGFPKVTRSDVADVMLQTLEHAETINRSFLITSKGSIKQ